MLGIGDAFSCGRGFFAEEFCEVPMLRAWSWRAVMGRGSKGIDDREGLGQGGRAGRKGMMSDDADKGNGDERRESERFGAVDTILEPVLVEKVIGVLFAVSVDQDVGVRHPHGLASLVSQFG